MSVAFHLKLYTPLVHIWEGQSPTQAPPETRVANQNDTRFRLNKLFLPR